MSSPVFPGTPAADPDAEAGPAVDADADVDVSADVEALYRDGVTARKGAFTPEWADRLGEDIALAFEEARRRPGGAVGRGPNRYYVEIHPEQIRGFVDLVDHPWVRSLCAAVLGPDYRIVEVGFDVPLAGAVDQPWHRDFPMPEETRRERRYTSLAFNVTTVDTTPDMGPFEIAPGTQWDDGPDFAHGMFPPKADRARYEQRAVRKFPQRGDISARSALTVHRGTTNHSERPRPVLVLGVDGPEATNGDRHDTAVTRAYWQTLSDRVRRHLDCPVVEALTPVTQKHTIEGLVMGDA
ncbi:phytanoyl-CoA dioxygenase family protein [Streptomyces pristinaespiralis]|uniref:Phytanoyl-CoA dioxygenase n=1 Tax=Streptomyces pristinaespiralis TaxID=38300 RepID=A0A0M4D523_STRPR|nr:phytanoyl-CoA dioxygenase family protein [Streptomyces pristinaespiralis]ALC18877.1 phytanoyl-CoA dioxygenase [Streptomyces pristinaespiralis]QMU17990.1 phytanoyl-CoA dioxygenase family protein [Streptomyces pristinaespiralis]